MSKADKDFSNKSARVKELQETVPNVVKKLNPNRRKRTKRFLGILVLFVIAVIAFALIYNHLTSCQVNVYAELNGQKLENNERYTVNPGDVVIVEAGSSEAKIAFITYYFVAKSTDDRGDGVVERVEKYDKVKVYDNSAEIVIPDGEPGSLINLLIEPVAENDDGSPNTVTKTGWQKFTFEYEK